MCIARIFTALLLMYEGTPQLNEFHYVSILLNLKLGQDKGAAGLISNSG
jgi:hypothetical protein